MVRVITLGDGRQTSLGNYVRGVRYAIDHPDTFFPRGLCGWGATGAEIRRQFRSGVHDRINQAVPYVNRGKEA